MNECCYKVQIAFNLWDLSCAYVSGVQQGFHNLHSSHPWVKVLTIIAMKVNVLSGMVVSICCNTYEAIGGK